MHTSHLSSDSCITRVSRQNEDVIVTLEKELSPGLRWKYRLLLTRNDMTITAGYCTILLIYLSQSLSSNYNFLFSHQAWICHIMTQCWWTALHCNVPRLSKRLQQFRCPDELVEGFDNRGKPWSCGSIQLPALHHQIVYRLRAILNKNSLTLKHKQHQEITSLYVRSAEFQTNTQRCGATTTAAEVDNNTILVTTTKNSERLQPSAEEDWSLCWLQIWRPGSASSNTVFRRTK